MTDLYTELKQAGCKIDNHESDLYVENTPKAREIIKKYGYCFTMFISQIEHTPWLDIPFMYSPWWDARTAKK